MFLQPLRQIPQYAASVAQVAIEFVLLQLIIVYFIIRNTYYWLTGFPCKQIRQQVVVITGAGQGLGRELAIQFAKQGAVLALVDLVEEKVKNVCNELKQLFPEIQAVPYQLDISNSGHVSEVFGRISNDLGGHIDILVNNAAITFPKPLLKSNEQNIRRIFEVNALGNFWTIRNVLPSMIERKQGHILTVASVAGFIGSPNMIDYTATKFATVGLMDGLRAELDAQGHEQIKTTTVCPGMMDTNMFQNLNTRFPTLLPIVKSRDVAEKAVKALLQDRELIFVPGSIYPYFYVPRMLLPFETRKYINRFIRCSVGEHTDQN